MTPPTTLPDSVSLIAANGMAFAKNKIVPYAKGGIVGSPTLFKYASGGADRFGLMGEAGPEAIMPLRRGANGKLGVEASGSSMATSLSTLTLLALVFKVTQDKAINLAKPLALRYNRN